MEEGGGREQEGAQEGNNNDHDHDDDEEEEERGGGEQEGAQEGNNDDDDDLRTDFLHDPRLCPRYQCSRCTKKTKTKSAMLPTSLMSLLHIRVLHTSAHPEWRSIPSNPIHGGRFIFDVLLIDTCHHIFASFCVSPS